MVFGIMSVQKTEKPTNHKPSAGKVIYIIGPRRLQNELIASCLKRETGAKCIIAEDINHILENDSKYHDRSNLVLLDCQGKDSKTLLTTLKAYVEKKQFRNYIVLFDVRPDLGIEKKCMSEGIQGVFYEQDSLDIFLKGVQAVYNGELWISRKIMTNCILEGKDKDKASKSSSTNLTQREIEVLARIAVGATNDEIADKLCISSHTVKTHLYNIFKKINVPNRLQAALWAAKNL